MKINSIEPQNRIWTLAISAVALFVMLMVPGAASAQWTTTGNDVYKTNTSGNVGIGTTSPAYDLDVKTSHAGTGVSGTLFRLRNDANGDATIGLISANATNAVWALGIDYSDGGKFKISNDNIYADAGVNTRFTIDGSGKVGIGTASPSYNLHVIGTGKFTGDLTVDGNIAAKFQDVAEWVPSSEQLSACTVVVLDSTRSNQVTSSTTSYDTRVAGVISEQPGIALGEKSDQKVLVATTGRVRVKVDASRAPIQIGDLLVTSDIPGVAMKSEPIEIGGRKIHMPGTLIGKALEPLEKGSGTILVLLSLQ